MTATASTPKISVILPCYNGASTLEVQLAALARQQWSGGWELVYVDNGSTDGSLEMVQRWAPKFPSVQFVQAWSGQGPRRLVTWSYMMGYEAAKGEFCLHAESDDEAGEGWLAAMAAALEQHELVASAMEYERLNAPELAAGQVHQRPGHGLQSTHPLDLPFAVGASMGMRRELWFRLGGYAHDVGAATDTDFCWRAHAAGVPTHFAPEAVMHYRLRSGAQSRAKQAKHYGESYALLWAKHSDRSLPRHLLAASKSLVRAAGGLAVASVAKRDRVDYWSAELAWALAFIGNSKAFLGPRGGRA
jgi:GT2 family glycosyltransferase